METFGTSVLCCYMSCACVLIVALGLDTLFLILFSQVIVVLNITKWFENTHTHNCISNVKII